MTKDQKLLSDLISSLINISNVLESMRGKLSVVDSTNFLKAQEYLVQCIQYIKRGKSSIDKNIAQSDDRKRGV